jgi:hypothetical protein
MFAVSLIALFGMLMPLQISTGGGRGPDPERSRVPWYETNLLWGPLAVGMGFVLTAVAAVKHDLRWLMWCAAVCFIFSFWALLRRRLRGWLLLVSITVIALIVCGISYQAIVWLSKPGVTAEEPVRTPQEEPSKPGNDIEKSEASVNKTSGNVRKALDDPKLPSPKSPTMTLDCAPGASCAQSTGQQGGITAGTVHIDQPLPPQINWSQEVLQPDKGLDQIAPHTTFGRDADQDSKQRMLKNPGVLVTIKLDKSWPANFAAECDMPCYPMGVAVTAAGGWNASKTLRDQRFVGTRLLMPNPLPENMELQWEIRSQTNDPIRITKVELVPY